MHLLSLALSTLLFSNAIANPIVPSESYALKERHAVPRGWTAVSRASSSHMISLQIALRQRNHDILQQHVIEVSDPTHARYGQYLSAEEVNDIIVPSDETINLVKSWLQNHKVSAATITPTKDSIFVTLPVEEVEQLLQTEYYVYRHEDGSELVRTPEWSLPEYLHEHIDVIQPTNSFFRPLRQAVTHVPSEEGISWHGGSDWWKGPSHYPINQHPGPGASCDVNVVCNVTGTNRAGQIIQATTLECLRCLYGTINYTPRVPNKNGIGVTNYLNQTSVRADIQQYLQLYRPEAAGVAYEFPIIIIANGQDDQSLENELDTGNSEEGVLDAELVLGISWPTSFRAWNTGGEPPFIPDLYTPTDTNEPYLTWQTYVLAQSSLPQVISTSYGDDEQTVPYSYAAKVCDNFKILAARGISVLFSSGDSGVGPNGLCYSNTDPSKYMFLPSFPASCPWVTAVGGTQGYNPEVAVQRFGSGAGFSNYFGRPAYQDSAVEGYLAKIGDLYAGFYNRSGRAYPDVAAQSNHDVIVWAGNVTTIGGTSAACPTVAAVIALVNDALIAAGRPALGFLNPWIYGGGYKAWTDITSGSAIGCDVAGFPAEVGWDAVTGFGTPYFPKLVAAAFHK